QVRLLRIPHKEWAARIRHQLAHDEVVELAFVSGTGRSAVAGPEIGDSTPIIGIAGCCARAASGHETAPPSVAKNFRRPMLLAMCPSDWGSFMQWRDDPTFPSRGL